MFKFDIVPAEKLHGFASGVKGWEGGTLPSETWLVPLPHDVRQELERVAENVRVSSAQPTTLLLDDFDLPRSRILMRDIRERLDHGVGFAVLDRLSVNEFGKTELKSIYWLLSQMIGPVVEQSPDGTVLHDVRDTGKKMSERVRGDLTNQELNWHTDNGFSTPPKYFGLAVLRTAKQGGESKAVNLVTAHEYLARGSPDLLRRLYDPFYWRRIGDGDDETTSQYPVFGELYRQFVCRVNRRVIEAGYVAAGRTLDAAGRDALNALYEVLDQPGIAFSYRLEPGQMQWMNNYALAHHRTTFVDWEEEDRRRHLVRIYMRDAGSPYGD